MTILEILETVKERMEEKSAKGLDLFLCNIATKHLSPKDRDKFKKFLAKNLPKPHQRFYPGDFIILRFSISHTGALWAPNDEISRLDFLNHHIERLEKE